jgi:hypothetical protein
MKTQYGKSSWGAFLLFYGILLAIISILDWANNLLTPSYWGAQAGLVTLGVVLFALVGARFADLRASHGVLLAFTVGILTIIPAALMGLGEIPGFWVQYFSIAFGMAAGSFLTFLFVKFSRGMTPPPPAEPESERDYLE